MAGHSPRRQRRRPVSQPQTPIEEGPGASDESSGGGAGSGVPDEETQMRTHGEVNKGDVKEDRAKLFPEAPGRPIEPSPREQDFTP